MASKGRSSRAVEIAKWDLDMSDDFSPKRGDESFGSESEGKKSDSTVVQAETSGIGRIIGYIWSTRTTLESGENDAKTTTTLRELIIYLVFLALICVMTFGMMSTKMYYFTNMMNTEFVTGTFDSLETMDDFWNYVSSTLMPGLYPPMVYNSENYTFDQPGYVLNENKLLGVPRFRQVRVSNDSCTVPNNFRQSVFVCYDSYYLTNEDTAPFGLATGPAWTYQTSSQLKGSIYSGQVATYSGGGYVQDLTVDEGNSTDLVTNLFSNTWTDRGTRAIFIDFSVYNANINLFCIVRLLAEIPATGGVLPYWAIRSVKLIRYVTPLDYFVMACEIIFVIFLVYYTIEELIEIKKCKLKYFKNFWNDLDVVCLIIGYVCMGYNLYRTTTVHNLLDGLLANPNDFEDFQFLSFCQVNFDSALAVMVFCSWVKLFKYISFNNAMTQLAETVGKCGKDLLGFAVMFVIFFMAFAQLGYLMFGTQLPDYSSITMASFSLFRLILGDFTFSEFQQVSPILGPMYFILYVAFIFFVLLNVFIAIINDTYVEVKNDLEEKDNDVEMGDYFKKKANKVLKKLHLKQEKILDIQSALKGGNENGDGIIDFDVWRMEMKKRGYADMEIEVIFSKYDLDGSRTLTLDEQHRMQLDLAGEQAELNAELKTKKTAESDTGVNGEVTALESRIERMELSVDQLIDKIDSVLVKLEASERAKAKRKETMDRLLDSISETEAAAHNPRHEQQEYETVTRSRARPQSEQD